MVLILAMHQSEILPLDSGLFKVAATPAKPPATYRRELLGRTYFIDTVSAEGRLLLTVGGTESFGFVVAPGQTVTVTGWALEPETLRPAEAMIVRVDQLPWKPVESYGLSRADVAQALSFTPATLCGFSVDLSLRGTVGSRHVIHFAIIEHSGRRFEFPGTIRAEIAHI
jgi:hypothetical protein